MSPLMPFRRKRIPPLLKVMLLFHITWMIMESLILLSFLCPQILSATCHSLGLRFPRKYLDAGRRAGLAFTPLAKRLIQGFPAIWILSAIPLKLRIELWVKKKKKCPRGLIILGPSFLLRELEYSCSGISGVLTQVLIKRVKYYNLN